MPLHSNFVENNDVVFEKKIDGRLTVKIFNDKSFYRHKFIRHVWLLENNEPVGYMKYFNKEHYNGFATICDLEVRKDKRGRKLSKIIYETVIGFEGSLHRTGTATPVAFKIAEEAGVIHEPSGRVEDRNGKKDYSFVVWDHPEGVVVRYS